MKLYAFIVLLVLFLLSTFGAVIPYLLSAKSDELVLAGILVLVIAIPVVYLAVVNIFKEALKLNRRRRK